MGAEGIEGTKDSLPVEQAAGERNYAPERDYPPQTGAFYLGLSVYWFALSCLWSGMITIVVQTLVKEMAGAEKDLYLGWTLALGALVSTVICLVVGLMSDRSRWAVGRRRPYILAGTLLAIPFLLWMAHVRSIASLTLAFCAVQFWIGVATSPYQALVPDLVPKQRQGTASAYMGLGSLLGQLGGLILCTWLITQPGGLWKIVCTLSVLLMAAMLFTLWHVPERPAAAAGVAQHSAEGAQPGGPGEGGENHSAARDAFPNSRNSYDSRGSFVQILRESFRINPGEYPDFFRLIASRFVINMGFYSATEFLLYYVSDTLRAPRPVELVGHIFIITTVSGLLGNFPAGVLSDRISKKRVLYISTAITGVAALVFLLTSSIPVALGAAFIFGAGFGAFQAVDWALATNLLPQRDEAKFMGVWHVAFTVPQVVAPLIGGVVAYFFNQQFGQGFGYRVVLFLVLVYLAIGTAMIRPIREKVHPR